MKKILSKKIIKFFKQFFLIDDTPHKVAGGLALGIFFGIVPAGGLLTTLFFATIFRLNKLAAIAVFLAMNIWATIIFLPFSAGIGAFIFHTDATVLIDNLDATYQMGWKFFLSKIIFLELLLPLFSGYVIIATTISLIFYFPIYYLLKYKKVSFR